MTRRFPSGSRNAAQWQTFVSAGPRKTAISCSRKCVTAASKSSTSNVTDMLSCAGVLWPAMMSSHFVTKLHHAALIGFDLRQMEGDVSVELLEEPYPIANQDRQDRITNFVG